MLSVYIFGVSKNSIYTGYLGISQWYDSNTPFFYKNSSHCFSLQEADLKMHVLRFEQNSNIIFCWKRGYFLNLHNTKILIIKSRVQQKSSVVTLFSSKTQQICKVASTEKT